MNVEHVADAVSGTVAKVHAAVPVPRLDDGVEQVAGRSRRELLARKRDVGLQGDRVVELHFVGQLAHRDRTGEVGRAAKIVGAHVKEKESLGLDSGGHRPGWAIVRQCGVFSVAHDRKVGGL